MKIDRTQRAPKFLQAGGEMGRLMREKDWSSTSLGPPADWPVSLKFAIGTMLRTAFPKFIWWGEDLICFYNDSYRPSLGKQGKHPNILGQKAETAWPEIWSTIKPLIDQVWKTEKPIWMENQLMPIFRNGRMEDVYWTFSYSALLGDDENVGGILVTCTETTEAVRNLKKLEESQDQLAFAINGAELGTWDHNPISNKFSGNQRLKSWFGIPRKKEIELSIALEAIVPADRNRVTQAINATLAGANGGKYDITYAIRNRKTQEMKTVHSLGRAWFNDKNEVIRFNGTLQDVTEQIASERENQKLLTLLDVSREFVGVTDNEGNALYVNPAGLKMLGWKNVKNKKLIDSIYSEDLGKAQDLLVQVKEKGGFSEEIRCFNVKTQKPFWLKWNVTEISDPNTKEIIGLGTVSTQIDMQRKREEDLRIANVRIRREEQRFRNIVQAAPVGIAIFKGRDYEVVMANNSVLRVLDKRSDIFLGQNIFEVLPELEADILPLFKEVRRKQKSVRGTEFKVSIKRKGEIQHSYFDFILHPINLDDEETQEIMLVANEVTDYIMARNVLKENEIQFRNLVLQSPIAMAILRGMDLKIEMANEKMLNHFWGRTFNDVIGRKMVDVFPELEDQQYPAELASVIATGKSMRNSESKAIIAKNGKIEEFYVNYDYLPLKELDGEVSGVMLTVTDVTDQFLSKEKLLNFSKELEKQVNERTGLLQSANERLEQSIKKLENANTELESFAYVSSHDLQEPLRKIQMFTSRILEQEQAGLSVKGKKYFDKIILSASRMRTLIDDLLSFSRTYEDDAKIESVDLNLIAEEVLENFSVVIENKNAQITRSNLPIVSAVPFQITQVFGNLLGNAIKFSKINFPPKIAINSELIKGKELDDYGLAEKSYHKITVKDNGIGIAKGMENKIFEVFQRLHGKHEYEGTGIGLSIVKKIIVNHKGIITATNNKGNGSTFTIYLPSFDN